MPQRTLKIPREEARRLLNQQIEKGQQLLNRDINEESELEQYIHDRKRYNQYNVEMLKNMFGKDEDSFWRFGLSSPPDWEDFFGHLNFYKEWDGKQVNELKGLEESLNLIPESLGEKPVQTSLEKSTPKTEVQLPDKLTAAWLWHHAPMHFWFWGVGIIVASFLAGATLGQTTFVQELLGKKQDQPHNQGQQNKPLDTTQNKTGIIKGVTMDKFGHTLPGVNVIVRDKKGVEVYNSTTDTNGSYITPPLFPDPYELEFKHEKYYQTRSKATVIANSEIVINAALEKTPYY
jgi:Carboxypeptidase regulatory-like domain